MNPQKKLKLILASFKDKQITKFLQLLLSNFQNQFKKNIRQISFNCYESVCEFKNKVVSGYGKNSNEAYINSVRTLVQLLADDSKIHPLMKECIREVHQQQNTSNYDSQKKLISIEKSLKQSTNKNSLNSSTKCQEKKNTLKQQIFQYLNLDNLKISNPNISQKTKLHDRYMNKSVEKEEKESEENLQEILRKNKDLEKKLHKAKLQNEKLKAELQRKSKYSTKQKDQNTKSRTNIKSTNKESSYQTKNTEDPLKTRTNQFLNLSQDCKLLQKQRMRSISVEANSQTQTQKYHIPRPPTNTNSSNSNQITLINEKKVAVPKLNLQVLPNYHGKSNKSLNQSLMEVYEKTHNK